VRVVRGLEDGFVLEYRQYFPTRVKLPYRSSNSFLECQWTTILAPVSKNEYNIE
jgi:hypothetical protein